MGSDWTLLEFRPGRYVKVTPQGEVIGKPTEAEIRAWFAIEPPRTGADLRETKPRPARPEPGPSRYQTRVISPAADPAPHVTQVEAPAPDDASPSAQPDEPTQDPKPEPVLARDKIPGPRTEPEPLPAKHRAPTPEPKATVPEPEPELAVAAVELPLPESEPGPPSDASPAPAVQPEMSVPEPEPEPEPAVARLKTPVSRAKTTPPAPAPPPPAPGPQQELWPEQELEILDLDDGDLPTEPSVKDLGLEDDISDPALDATPVVGIDGRDRWLWVDPRSEIGYNPATFEAAAFLERAVALFQTKSWVRGQRPGRLMVHPDELANGLEEHAEALDLAVLTDPTVTPGTYRLALAEEAE